MLSAMRIGLTLHSPVQPSNAADRDRRPLHASVVKLIAHCDILANVSSINVVANYEIGCPVVPNFIFVGVTVVR